MSLLFWFKKKKSFFFLIKKKKRKEEKKTSVISSKDGSLESSTDLEKGFGLGSTKFQKIRRKNAVINTRDPVKIQR